MPFILHKQFSKKYVVFFQLLPFNSHVSRPSQGYTKREGRLSSHQCNLVRQSCTWQWVRASRMPLQNSESLWLLSLTHHDPTTHEGQLNPSSPQLLFPHGSQSDLRLPALLHQCTQQPHPWSSRLCLALSGSPLTTENLKGKIWLPYSANTSPVTPQVASMWSGS